jgi:hypothetical protein
VAVALVPPAPLIGLFGDNRALVRIAVWHRGTAPRREGRSESRARICSVDPTSVQTVFGPPLFEPPQQMRGHASAPHRSRVRKLPHPRDPRHTCGLFAEIERCGSWLQRFNFHGGRVCSIWRIFVFQQLVIHRRPPLTSAAVFLRQKHRSRGSSDPAAGEKKITPVCVIDT